MGLNRDVPARDAGYQNIQYLRKQVTFADNGKQIAIGSVPKGATILKPISGAQIEQAFNAGTNNYIDIGTPADDDYYATDLAGGTVTFVPLDEAVPLTVAADTVLTVTVGLTGTAATTGRATIVIGFIPAN